jgi:hypothetical protein
MTCSNCGGENTPQSRFCIYCGAALIEDGQADGPDVANRELASALKELHRVAYRLEELEYAVLQKGKALQARGIAPAQLFREMRDDYRRHQESLSDVEAVAPVRPETHAPAAPPEPSVTLQTVIAPTAASAPIAPPVQPPREPAPSTPPLPSGVSKAQAMSAAEGPQPIRVEKPRREPIRLDLAAMWAALLSERTLHAMLYVGALLLFVSSLALTGISWQQEDPVTEWGIRQAFLAIAAIMFFRVGYMARMMWGLRRSGGVLLSIGALWVPLVVGHAVYRFIPAEGALNFPGVDVAIDLPVAGWFIIAASGVPVYGALSIRYRLPTLAYAAGMGLGATLFTGLTWAGVSLEWRFAAMTALGPAYLLLARELARRGLAELHVAPLWLAHLGAPAILAVLVGRVLVSDATLPLAIALWFAVAQYGLALTVQKNLLFEYILAAGLPTAFFLTLWSQAPGLELAWYAPMIVVMAAGYVAFGRFVRRSLLWSMSQEPVATAPTAKADSTYVVGFILSFFAFIWPPMWNDASDVSRLATLYGLVGLYGASACLLKPNPWLFEYLGAGLLPLAVGLSLQAAELPVGWYGMAFAALGSAYVLVGRALRPRAVTGLDKGVAFLLQPYYLVGYILTLVALTWRPMWEADTEIIRVATLYSVVALYAGSAYLLKPRAWFFEYLAAGLTPLAVGSTLQAASVPVEWYGLAFVVLGSVYVLFGRLARPAALVNAEEAGWPIVSRGRSETCPYYLMGYALALVGALWLPAWQSDAEASRIATTYGAVGLMMTSAYIFRQRLWAYGGVFLLFLPYGMTLQSLNIGPHWRGLVTALLAVGCVALAELEARRSGERRKPLRQLLVDLTPPGSPYAAPLFLAGYLTAIGVLGLATYDILAYGRAGDPSPWPYLIVAALGAASAYLRRSSAFVPFASLSFVAFFLALSSRGFYIGVELSAEGHAVGLGFLALGYLLAAFALDRLGRGGFETRSRGGFETRSRGGFETCPYSGAVHLTGYLLTVAAMVGTTPDRALNAGMVGLAIAIYAASAYLAHVGRHPTFQGMVARLFPGPVVSGAELKESVAHKSALSLFLYITAWLLPLEVVLALRLLEPAQQFYGLAMTLLAPLYVALGLWFRRVRPEYGTPWLYAGYALSTIGPLVSAASQDMLIATLALSIGLYAASGRIFRQPFWIYLTALTLPLLAALVMGRFELPIRYYGPAMIGLALLYLLAGQWMRAWTKSPLVPLYERGRQVSFGEDTPISPLVSLYERGRQVSFGEGTPKSPLVSLYERGRQVSFGEGTPISPFRKGGLRGILSPSSEGIGAFALPFMAVGPVLAALGLAIAASSQAQVVALFNPDVASSETKALIVASFALGALYYMLSAVALRQQLFLYPAAILPVVSYGVGLSIIPTELLPAAYRGLALIPLVVAYKLLGWRMESISAWPEGRARREPGPHPSLPPQGEGTFSSPSGGGLRWGRVSSQMAYRVVGKSLLALPFYLVAFCASLAIPALSMADPWVLVAGLMVPAAMYAFQALMSKQPAWLYPALLSAHLGFIHLAYLVADGSWARVGVYCAPLALATWVSAEWASRRRTLAEGWAMPLWSFAWLGLLFSLGASMLDHTAGLGIGLAYGVLLGGFSFLRRQQALAYASLGAFAVAFAEGLLLANVSLAHAPVYIAVVGLAVTMLGAWARSSEGTGHRVQGTGFVPDSPRTPYPVPRTLTWREPIRHASVVLTALALLLSVGATLSEVADPAEGTPFQWLAVTAAITGLNVIWRAFEVRSWRLSYLGVAMVEVAYMVILALTDITPVLLYAVPAGAYLLGVAYLEWRRGTSAPVRALEAGGLALLLGVPMWLSISEAASFVGGNGHIYNALFLFFGSLAVSFLGAIMRWKRPFIGGIVVFVANLFTLLSMPVQLVDEWWWMVLGIALVFIASGVLLERHRERLIALGRELAARLEQWY